jgi:hypothetical protein
MTTLFDRSFVRLSHKTDAVLFNQSSILNRTTTFKNTITTAITKAISAISFLFITIAFLSGLVGCDSPPKNKATHRQNCVIVLDLSDRLLAPNQAATDQALLRQCIQAFADKAKNELYLSCQDRIRILVPQQQNASYDWAQFDDSLQLDLAKVDPQNKRKIVFWMQERWPIILQRLYAQATVNTDRHRYAGAQLWRTFSEVLPNEMPDSASTNARIVRLANHNKLVVLTDGYLDFESAATERNNSNLATHSHFVNTLAAAQQNWPQLMKEKNYGFLPTGHKLPHAEAIVLEVNPKAHYHAEILQSLWLQWLGNSNIRTRGFLQVQNVPVAKNAIQDMLRTD